MAVRSLVCTLSSHIRDQTIRLLSIVITGAAALVSACTRNRLNYTGILSQMLIAPDQATASLQSGLEGFTNSFGCSQFDISFWCKFGGIVHATGDTGDVNRLFLELWLHRRNASIDGPTGPPGRLIWGSVADYSSTRFEPDVWKQISFRFTESAEFSVIFFAHHNHNCTEKQTKIYLDDVAGFSGNASKGRRTTSQKSLPYHYWQTTDYTQKVQIDGAEVRNTVDPSRLAVGNVELDGVELHLRIVGEIGVESSED